jgi:cholesterol oxidase
MTQPFDADFIVVGSGFGRAVSTLRLTEKGYSVIVLEQGRRYRTEAFRLPGWSDGEWRSRLAPHYEGARRMLGATRSDGVGCTDHLLREVGAELTGEGTLRVHDVGVFFGEPGERVPDPFFGGEGPDRVGCTRCAACMIGCPVGAKV